MISWYEIKKTPAYKDGFEELQIVVRSMMAPMRSQITALQDEVGNLHSLVSDLQRQIDWLKNPQLEKDALAAEAEANRTPGFQTQVRR